MEMSHFEDSTEIAIIGMAGRFPGAADVHAFWRNLRDGVESIVQFSDEDLLAAGVEPDELKDPNYVKAGAILEDIDRFDASFFGLTPREAEILDPQHRLFLEAAWNALESGGYNPESYDGSIAVFGGVGLSTYLLNNLYPNRDLLDSVGLMPIILGNDKDSLATRVAYLLDLTGPCYTVQTFCSTSLVAASIACESLLAGECDMALAGGVLVSVPQKEGYYYQEGGIASPDGRCRAFDAKAKGSPLGNGVAVVLLKRLEDAVADGDTIYALVKGWAVNNDGALRAGFTAPGVRGQAGVILEAMATAQVDAESIGYIEAHGTGTALGDAVEFAAMMKAFAEHTDKKGYCAVGSVKTNVGHLDRAAGVTSLIKATLALKHRLIPPSLNYEEPNPEIVFSDTPFYVNTELKEWPCLNGQPRRAGVSSFGMGGTNAHLILEEAPLETVDPPARPYQLLLLSAKSDSALNAAQASLRDYLQDNSDSNMADVAYTLQVGRKAFAHRRMLVCQEREDALQALEADDQRVRSSINPTQERSIVFMFPGVGDHYVNMGRELYRLEPIFRRAVDRCCDLLQPILDVDLRNFLYPAGADVTTTTQQIDLRRMMDRNGDSHSDSAGALSRTEIAQPAVFVIEYALAQLLQAWGITPDALIGYSLGEYVSACVAGVLSLQDALTLVARRAQLIQGLPVGGMVAVALSETEVQPFLDEDICLAVINGPAMCVLSGSTEALTRLERRLEQEEIGYRRLETGHAFHSSQMESIADEFATVLQSTALEAPQIPYLSNVTGDWITDEEATDPAYWIRHLCQTVRFNDGLAELLSDSQRIVLEVGPGQSLCSFARQHPECDNEQLALILPTLRYAYNKQSDEAFLLETLGRLWLTGLSIEWSRFYSDERRRRIPLPTYPFQRRSYWIDSPKVTALQPEQQTITRKRGDVADWFYEPRWQPAPLDAKDQNDDVDRLSGTVWLIFEHETGPGTAIARQLRKHGASSIVRVRDGETFSRLADDLFAIRPTVSADYERLLDTLIEAGSAPTQIVHLWSLDRVEEREIGVAAFSAAQESGFYPLLYLAQALGKQNAVQSLQLTVLTQYAQPLAGHPIRPENATLTGLCRVIPQEYPSIECRTIDIAADAGGETGVAQLVAELTAPRADVAVAYRDNVRYLQQFEPKQLLVKPTSEQLRPSGVYLITGGLGNIGLVLAEYLARRLNARLVLTCRSGLPPRNAWSEWLTGHGDDDPTSRKIRRVQALQEAGAEVLVLQADVANQEAMQAVVDQVYKQFGTLNGVIHAAGLTNREAFPPIQDSTHDICESHFRAKAHGLYVLDKVLADTDVDFCLLFSSLSAVLGGLGFAAYAAANNFMDVYTHAHNRASSSPWTSVDWDTWKVMQTSNLPVGATVAEFEMTPEEGVQSFCRAVASGATQLVNSTGDLDARIRQWVTLEAARQKEPSSGAAHARPELSTDYVPVSNEYEKHIAAIWQDVLGIDQIGIHDNFFDLGGNSLVGLQVVSRIQKEFDTQLSVVALFDAPTVSALAEYVRPEEASGPASDTGAGPEREEAALLERRHHARRNVNKQDIAVIGMAGRFPGARTVDQFWENICNGVESIARFSDEELLASGVNAELLDEPNYVKARPIIDDADLFDAGFFGYSPREAEILDPQHRLFLESTWEALELAGYNPIRYKGLIGVFAGTNISTYLLSWFDDPQIEQRVNTFQAVTSNDKDSLTTTVSYKLNLRGPSFAVQTFCSTSLVATHLACQSLLNGECNIALAGGVSIRIPQKQGYLYQEGGQESPDGHCRTFDARAQGSLFGDGVGVVVLKQLDEALADGDTIHAVIKGSAINNDGSLKVGYTAPSVAGQAEAVSAALEHADVRAETIGYVEAHGTATELGDPIEVASLSRAFGRHTEKKAYCAIGSVKTNMGHLDRAAGVTGLIKAVLAVEHGLMPPSLHFETPNPEIDFDNSPFYVNTKLATWQTQDGTPRRAGVNSLGMGGTNAHVVVEEPPQLEPPDRSRPHQLLLLSARTESALDAATANLAHYLRQNPNVSLADVAHTLQVGRRSFEHRRMLVCQETTEALSALESLDPQRVLSRYQQDVNRPVVFLFPGVGDHYVGMARELYEGEPVFRDAMEQCCAILYPYLGSKLCDLLYPGDEPASPKTNKSNGSHLQAMLAGRQGKLSASEKRLNETAVAQPVVFAIEYAMARLLMSWGVQPQAVVGYSLGEYTAACISGVLSLEDALNLVAQRAQMIQSLPTGSMVSVALSEEAVKPLLSEEISLAAHNGKAMCVLAGTPEAINRLETELGERGVAFRHLDTSHAFHSKAMAPLAEPLVELVQTMTLTPPRIPCISNVTGTWVTAEQATDPGYWAQHMCQPVRFFETLTELLKDDSRVLLEVGPGQPMSSFAKQHPACSREQVQLILPTMRHVYDSQSDYSFLLNTLGKLWLLGFEPDWSSFYEREHRYHIPLPTYPFERQRYWLKATPRQRRDEVQPAEAQTPEQMISSLPRRRPDDWFYLPAWKQVAPQIPEPVGEKVEEDACWLIFTDSCGLGTEVTAWLKEQGQRTIIVRPGASFKQADEDCFEVQPRIRADYDALLNELQQQGLKPRRVVHLWTVTPEEDAAGEGDWPERVLDVGFYSLMALAQSIGERNLASCEVTIVSSYMQAVTGDEHLCPHKATVIGPCRVIPLEYTKITCRCVDVVLPSSGSTWAKPLLMNLLGVLTANTDDTVIALRGRHQWVQTFEPIDLPSPPEHSSRLRSQGVYLITGGLGGIGLALAEHLAQTAQAKLILVSRSGLPPRNEWSRILEREGEEKGVGRKVKGVQHLEALGAEVLALAADVTDEGQMQAVVQEAIDRFGTIHGVIHAAGVPGMGLIQLKTPEMAAQVLGPKVKGTLVLERVLQGVELDFLALFSSITSVTGGGPGQIDYCAANAFMDAYARCRADEEQRTTSISWGEWQWNAWEEGLEGFGEDVQNFFRKNRQRFGIAFDEGCEALERILTCPLPQVVVSTQDFKHVAELSKDFTIATILNWGNAPDESQTKHPRPALGTTFVAPRNQAEQRIEAIWEDILGISEIGINDNFFDLGGNSLIGLDLVARLRTEFEMETIPAHILYEAPTIRTLAAFIDQGQKEASFIAKQKDRSAMRRQRYRQRKRNARSRE